MLEIQQLAAKTTLYCILKLEIPNGVLCKDGNFLQDLLIEEGVAAVDALSRAAVLELQVDEKHRHQWQDDINPSLPCLKRHLRSDIKVLQALRALNPLGPLAVPVAAPLCSAQKTSRQPYGDVWSMAFGFGF